MIRQLRWFWLQTFHKHFLRTQFLGTLRDQEVAKTEDFVIFCGNLKKRIFCVDNHNDDDDDDDDGDVNNNDDGDFNNNDNNDDDDDNDNNDTDDGNSNSNGNDDVEMPTSAVVELASKTKPELLNHFLVKDVKLIRYNEPRVKQFLDAQHSSQNYPS